MFSSGSGHTPGISLYGTCAVCHAGIEPLPGALEKGEKCKQCQKTVCSKCFSRSRSLCVYCATGKDGWCITPKPKFPGI